MDEMLTKDEFEALAQISPAKREERISACVARNTKHLTGFKYIASGRNGQLALTAKGQHALFVQRCIDGLRAIANDALTTLDAELPFILRPHLFFEVSAASSRNLPTRLGDWLNASVKRSINRGLSLPGFPEGYDRSVLYGNRRRN